MEIAGMHHMGLTVTSLARSLAYYKEMFGLEPEFIATGDGEDLSRAVGIPDAKLTFAFLRVGGGTVELIEYGNERRTSYDGRNCDAGTPHLCFDVPDIDAAYRELRDKGADFYAEPFRITGGPLHGCAFAYL
ncbi:MAG TPA: VOC family protein, partial [Streptosporangiaceae bacterium]|nr:VOC family protein [Streptosporangiaceae bacterium]